MYQRSGRIRTLSSISTLVASQRSITRKGSTRGSRGASTTSTNTRGIESDLGIWTKLTVGAIVATSAVAAYVKYSRKDKKNKKNQKASKKTVIMKGLPNLTGNLCFLNSLLQALASVPSFLTYLEEKDQPFMSSLSSCLEDLNISSGSSTSNRIYAVLNNIRDAMKRRGMEIDEQNDVQELYHVFMDMLETESRTINSSSSSSKCSSSSNKTITPLLSNHRPQHVFSPISAIVQDMNNEEEEGEEEQKRSHEEKSASRLPMLGLMASLLRCQDCGHIAPIKLTPFNDVSVDLVSSSSLFSSTRLHAGTTFQDDEGCVVGVERSFNCKEPCHGLKKLYMDERSFLHSPLLSLTSSSSSSSSKHQQVTLRGCLKHFTSAEVLQSVECERCKTAMELREETKSSSNRRELLETKLRRLNIENELRDSLQKQYWKSSNSKDEDNISRVSSTSPRPPALRQDVLSRLPVVLCVHIRRRQFCSSTNRQLKISGHVRFDLILHVDSFCDRTLVGTQLSPYRLVSVIVHHGSFGDGGHFTTYRRCVLEESDEEVWLCCNDEKVHVVDVREVLCSEAYMLFYEQIL